MLDLSLVIVNLNAEDYLLACLRSVRENTRHITNQVFVVDNGSRADSLTRVRAEFPDAEFLTNATNLGFARATNQGIRASNGRYVLLLNPDTIVLANALDELVAFADAHPQVGVVGPRVLNRDGSLQQQCRRSFAMPIDLICYFLGLSHLFPQSRVFARYLLTHKDPNTTDSVDAVSGSCMLIRRETLDHIGLLDERFFAYQEDTDYCWRAWHAGWQVIYYPVARIIHLGGYGGSRSDPYRSIWEWHKSYWLYYRKNLAARYFFVFNWLYYTLMLFKLASAMLIYSVSREKPVVSRKP